MSATRHGDNVNIFVAASGTVIRPILFTPGSTNHIAPSGPAVMPAGCAPPLRVGYSVTTPAGVMRPIWLADA